MWICNDCGAVFENPREYYEHDTGYHGMDCPHCGSDDIDEAERCSECDEWVNEKNLVNGLCNACIEKHVADYETVKAYGAARKECIELNGFLTWAFAPDQIEEILDRELRNTETLKTTYSKDFATDDPDDFTDRQDLLSKPYFDVGRNVLEHVSGVYIIPNRRKHYSGYNCMDMVATLEDGTQYRIAGSCDDIGFYGEHFRIDCDYPSRIIHVWNTCGSFAVHGISSINFEED